MPRRPRLHFPGAPYHVILRGNARQDIFFEDEDRYRFCFLVQEEVERSRHRVAFRLMTNHVHPAIQVAHVPLSRIPRSSSRSGIRDGSTGAETGADTFSREIQGVRCRCGPVSAGACGVYSFQSRTGGDGRKRGRYPVEQPSSVFGDVNRSVALHGACPWPVFKRRSQGTSGAQWIRCGEIFRGPPR